MPRETKNKDKKCVSKNTKNTINNSKTSNAKKSTSSSHFNTEITTNELNLYPTDFHYSDIDYSFDF